MGREYVQEEVPAWKVDLFKPPLIKEPAVWQTSGFLLNLSGKRLLRISSIPHDIAEPTATPVCRNRFSCSPTSFQRESTLSCQAR